MLEVYEADTYKELLMVLSNCSYDIISKIPDSVMQEINGKAADSNKEYYFDKNKSLDEQEVSEDCLDLLSILYYKYVADEEEKRKII